MNSLVLSEDKKNKLSNFVLLSLILIGFLIRIKGLGRWPLAVDEYYIVKSAENILKYGLPMWDAGGYYSRGLPQQYLTALLLMLGLKAEFASRIIPLLANIAAIPGVYLTSKKISGKMVAVAAAFIFTFSVWEVEFSRFARMYAPFQTIFIWYIYILYKTLFENNKRGYYWLWILSFFSIFIYEGSIFLVILNFLPLVWDNDKRTFNPFLLNIYKKRIFKIILCIAILIAAYAYLTFNFRGLFVQKTLPDDADVTNYFKNISSEGIFRMPFLLINAFSLNQIWIFLFIVPLLLSAWTVLHFLKNHNPILSKIGFTLILFFSLLNLLGFAFVLFLIFLFIGWIEPKYIFNKYDSDSSKKTGIKIISQSFLFKFIFAVVINFIFWIIFAVNTKSWYYLIPAQNVSNKLTATKFFLKESINYPYFYETFVLFRNTIPIISFISVFIIILGTIYVYLNYYKENLLRLRILFFLFLFLILAVDTLNLSYFDTRYFFFLYPLLIILTLISLEKSIKFIINNNFIRKVLYVLAIIVLLILSEDFNLNHLIKIDSKEINFRMNYNLPLTIHYYPRWDSQTVADIVNKESLKEDIIITNEQPSEFYLKRLDYIFRDYKSIDFPGESVLRGTKERWTSAKLIYKYSDLNRMIDGNKKRIWLIINTMWGLEELDSLVEKYNKYLYSRSIDGRTLLYKIP
ncbi:MAG TPA: glycosyltransferase family 39 protein [Ignavibacteriaceae bacterium]|nr:glycosyltransferase family 39 protein [Ignavibacteriaceae bacterium]